MNLRRISLIIMTSMVWMVSCKNTPTHKKNNSATNDSLSFAKDLAGLELPKDFKVIKVAEQIGDARRIAIRKNGDMYVSLNSTYHGHPLVALRDTTDNGQADVIKYFGETGSGTGLRLYNHYLYFGSDTAVVRYKLTPNQLVPDSKAELIASLPKQHEHKARSLAFDGDGHMFVNIGAPSNSCQKQDRQKGSMGQKPCPLLKKYGGIWQFDADQLNQDKDKDGVRYVTGTRNCVALDFNPHAQNLYAVMHGRDQLYQNFPEYYDQKESAELPAEEFLLFKKGAHYGWPYVYWDQKQDAFAVAPEYGGNGEKLDQSGDYEKPIEVFPAHWAPNGLLFYTKDQFPDTYRNGAFVAFHGSWNRAPEPQKGFKIMFVPFDKDLPSGKSQTFADGFTGTSKPIRSPGDARYRPCGLNQGPDGSLYITDDHNGTIFRVVYTGEKTTKTQ